MPEEPASFPTELLDILDRAGHMVRLIDIASRDNDDDDTKYAFAIGLETVADLLRQAIEIAKR